MKCKVCSGGVEETFLNKVVGTYVKDGKNKKQIVCTNCQKTLSMDDIKKKLPQ